MYYVIAIICGLLLGALVALAKHIFIWQPYARGRSDNLYGRMTVSSGVNVLTLLLVFLLRKYWPYSFEASIAAVAVALAFGGKLLAQKK